MFWTFFHTPIWAQTNASSSMPTPTTITWGLPSGLIVSARVARSQRARAPSRG
jgi:hypothetical protein